MAGIIMHTRMSEEFTQGLQKMKYSLNHPWKFETPKNAFFAGMLQTLVLIMVTFCNYFVIIGEKDVSNVLINFLALLVISELDNFFFISPSSQ